MFSAYVGLIGDQFFFSLVLILRIPAYLGIKGGQFFSDKNFFRRSFYVQIGVIQFVSCVQIYVRLSNFYAKLNVSNLYVLVLVQVDLIQFEFSNCIRSICTKTNTNLLHTNSLHSISCKIGHIIQIVVHQFVRKTSAEKNLNSEKNSPPFSSGMREYIESVLRRKN